jgi:hypothetical protein
MFGDWRFPSLFLATIRAAESGVGHGGKAVPVTGRRGLPHCLDSGVTDGGVVAPCPQENSFLIEAESSPGPSVVRFEGFDQLKVH